MAQLEFLAAEAEASARRQLADLAGLVKPAARHHLAQAAAALDRCWALNLEIAALSRRNSNVRSLALSLGQKRTVTATCEEALHAIQVALAERGFSGTR